MHTVTSLFIRVKFETVFINRDMHLLYIKKKYLTHDPLYKLKKDVVFYSKKNCTLKKIQILYFVFIYEFIKGFLPANFTKKN